MSQRINENLKKIVLFKQFNVQKDTRNLKNIKE